MKSAALACLLLLPTPDRGADMKDAGAEMAECAGRFLSSLSPEQKGMAVFPFADDERLNWTFLPVDRKGFPIKEMDDAQRALASGLISSGLSAKGFQVAMVVMSLEKVLWEMENHSPKRDAGRYFLSIFGEPGAKIWGWRLEGRHLASNFLIKNDELCSATPFFMASNPGEVREGPRKGLQLLKGEDDGGRELVTSLTDAQRAKAVFSDQSPAEILSSTGRDARPLEPKGIDLPEKQRADLRALILLYVDKFRPDWERKELARLDEEGWENVSFAWAGGVKPGEGHYYRIQTPWFLIEFANTQNETNHVHTVWRDLQGDFGADVLREHFENSKH